jgi:hypothetical protein
MTRGDIHVIRTMAGWSVVRGSASPLANFKSLKAAVTAGRELAKAYRVQIFVHGENGIARHNETGGAFEAPDER